MNNQKKIKKILIAVQILLVLLFAAKIAALGEIMQKTDKSPQAPMVKQAVKDVSSKGSAGSGKEAAGEGLVRARDLNASLEAKKSELDKREQLLKSEEQRLLSLKKEILEKIDSLRAEEEKLNVARGTNKTAEAQRFKDLAKVFEATPPAKAGVMLEKLDVQTAAGISMNMKRDKAGAIWGYLSPQKAVEITREVTRTGN